MHHSPPLCVEQPKQIDDDPKTSEKKAALLDANKVANKLAAEKATCIGMAAKMKVSPSRWMPGKLIKHLEGYEAQLEKAYHFLLNAIASTNAAA